MTDPMERSALIFAREEIKTLKKDIKENESDVATTVVESNVPREVVEKIFVQGVRKGMLTIYEDMEKILREIALEKIAQKSAGNEILS